MHTGNLALSLCLWSLTPKEITFLFSQFFWLAPQHCKLIWLLWEACDRFQPARDFGPLSCFFSAQLCLCFLLIWQQPCWMPVRWEVTHPHRTFFQVISCSIKGSLSRHLEVTMQIGIPADLCFPPSGLHMTFQLLPNCNYFLVSWKEMIWGIHNNPLIKNNNKIK